jgi:alkylhydroperoxidase family enzyme
VGSHTAGAVAALGDEELVQQVLDDYLSSRLLDAEKALFVFIEKVNSASNQIRQTDIDELKKFNWTDEAIYDAVTVCSLFNFYNRWNDAMGTTDMPAFAYEMTGKRIVEHGYFQEREKGREGERE